VVAFAGPVEATLTDLYERARRIEATHRWPARKWVSGIKAENDLKDVLDFRLRQAVDAGSGA